MSILIVDDNAVSARMAEVSLQRNGYQTVVVSSGAAALELLSEVLDIQLMILDVMMPDMDGLTLLDLVRRQADLGELPVILCTARTDPDTLARARSLGCKRIVGKPIRLADLLTKVREETANERPVLQDRFRVMARIGVDFQTYRDVAQAFSSVVRDQIQDLESSPLTVGTFNVSGLREGAELIGAERLFTVIRRIDLMGESPLASDVLEMQRSMLLRELKSLMAPLEKITTQT